MIDSRKDSLGLPDFGDFATYESTLVSSSPIEDLLYYRDVKDRKLFLTMDISQETINDAVRHILYFNKEDKAIAPENRKPIIIYISSCGGDEDAGFVLIDTILNSKTPVYTVNLGYQYSMGFLIGIAGHKRFATPNAKFLFHDGEIAISDSMTKMKDYTKWRDKVEDRTKEYVLSHSKITGEEYDQKQRMEWYMYADEAKEKGFTDYIIGIDCDIDAIV